MHLTRHGLGCALVTLWLCLAPASAMAQDPALPALPVPDAAPNTPADAVPADLVSPRDTMRAFLEAMNDLPDSWARAVDCLELTAEQRDHDPRQFARDLYFVLNRIEWVDIDRLPGHEEVKQWHLTEYVFFPRGYEQRDVLGRLGDERPAGRVALVPDAHGAWRFSPGTVGALPALRAQFERHGLPRIAGSDILTPADYLRQLLPESWEDQRLLTLEYWQWAALLVLLVIGFALDLLVRGVFALIMVRVTRGDARSPVERRTWALKAARPFGLLAAGIAWLSLLWLVDLPELAHVILHGAASIFTVLAGTWATWRLTDVAFDRLSARAERTDTKIDDVLYPLVRRALKVLIVIFGVIYAAESVNIETAPLLASLGVGSLAFAFAARDTIENFFGSVAVLLDQPFEVGDWVVIGEAEGIVEEIGFRSSRIRTFYNSQITVPNANLVRANVDNYGRRKYRRWMTTLGVQYDTTPEQLVSFTEGIRELVRSHPYTRKDYFQVWCNEFGASSLNILVYVFFEVPDWSTELRERERLFLDVLRLADQLGVSFAFPTTTVHLHHEPADAAHQPARPPQSLTERRAQVAGIRSAQKLVAQQPWLTAKPGPVLFKGGPTYVPIDPATGQPLDPEAKTAIEDRTAGG